MAIDNFRGTIVNMNEDNEINSSFRIDDYFFQKQETSNENRLCEAISHGRFDLIDMALNDGDCIHTCSCHVSPMYYALTLKNYGTVDHLLKRKAHFGAVQTTGPFAGFTALHYLCLEDEWRIVENLLDDYKVDPNVKAVDGVEPIHLAVLRGHYFSVIEILKAGADVATELSYSHFKKYSADNNKWNHNFGNRMTLITYMMFNFPFFAQFRIEDEILTQLFSFKPNCIVSDMDNKTLLMYAAEMGQIDWVEQMVHQYCERKKLDGRDNQGFTAVHYSVSLDELLKSGFNIEIMVASVLKEQVLKCLERNNANLNVMIDNDPKTLPIHMAARNCNIAPVAYLCKIQAFYAPSTRPLLYAVQDHVADLPNNDISSSPQSCKYKKLIYNRQICETVEEIIEHIYIKKFCRFFVPKEEINLMEELVKNEIIFMKFIVELDKQYKEIFCLMKNTKILFGTRNMSLYEILMASPQEYIKVAKNENYELEKNTFKLPKQAHDKKMVKLYRFVEARLNRSKSRVDLLKKWEVISYLATASFTLPYDCLLYIIECLINDDLENFIQAFIK